MTAQLSQATPDNVRFLQRVLYGNAAFSIVTASAFAFASTSVAALLGLTGTSLGNIGTPVIVAGIGVATLAFAAYVIYVTRPPLRRALVWSVIALDLAWVIGSVGLLLAQVVPFSRAGAWTVLLIADVVLLLAIMQIIGLRRLR